MGVLVEANIDELIFQFGTKTLWRGKCSLTVGDEPEIRSADPWPKWKISDQCEYSVSFHVKGAEPIDRAIYVSGGDAFQRLAEEQGYCAKEQDLACLAYYKFKEREYVQVAVFLEPSKFEFLNGLLHRHCSTGRRISFGFSFNGFRTSGFDEVTVPTMQEFEKRAPYLTRQDLEFSLFRGPGEN